MNSQSETRWRFKEKMSHFPQFEFESEKKNKADKLLQKRDLEIYFLGSHNTTFTRCMYICTLNSKGQFHFGFLLSKEDQEKSMTLLEKNIYANYLTFWYWRFNYFAFSNKWHNNFLVIFNVVSFPCFSLYYYTPVLLYT